MKEMTRIIDSFRGEHKFLSNFYPAKVVYERIEYPSSEHAFQAAKTSDPQGKVAIRDASTPSKAKRLGRNVPLRSDWKDIKLQVMKDIVRAKFTQNADLRIWLVQGTRNTKLIECNTWGDKFWGVCHGEGENHLGRILMEIRKELSNAQSSCR